MNDNIKNKEVLDKGQPKVIDVNKVIMIVMRRWYVVVLSIVVCVVVAYINLRYTKPLYEARLTMKMDDEKPNQINDFFKYRGATGKLENFLRTESEMIKSKTFAEKAVKELDYTISYYKSGKILTQELYPNKFFQLDILYNRDTLAGHVIQLEFADKKHYKVAQIPGRVFTIDDTIFYYGAVLKVNATEFHPFLFKQTVACAINNYHSLAGRFAGGLTVENVRGTSILELTYVCDVPQLASDYLNTVAKVYIQETINNKSLAAEQTLSFISDQLDELSGKVKQSEDELTDLKAQNKGVWPEEMSSHEFVRLSNVESQNNILKLKLKLLETLEKNVRDAKDRVTFINIDQEDIASLDYLFSALNKILVDHLTLKGQHTSLNPRVIESENKIKEMKAAILESLKTIRNKTVSAIEFNDRVIAEGNENLVGLPEKTRHIMSVQREFRVNEKVYSYLLEKRLETLVSKASITSSATIVDKAEVPGGHFYPIANKTLSFALLVGFVSGMIIVFGSRVVYQKIPDKETIENSSNTPVIGVIQRMRIGKDAGSQYEIFTFKNPKSIFSESIRSIRTGINFLLNGEDHKIICLTSTVSGEGKTFITINLAASICLTEKKVLVIGCDLRRPKLHLSFPGMGNNKGLSTYLTGKDTLEDIIQETTHENLSVITAGPISPNPSELLQSEKMTNLLAYLKNEYDYVLLDSAPVGLVSDAMNLMKLADINLFIFRALYSKRDFTNIPDRLAEDSNNNIKNIFSILNSYDSSGVAYSSIYRASYSNYYGGGYYYYGGYYGKSSYGYYGRKYYSSYYSGYYSEDEMNPPTGFIAKLKQWFRGRNKGNKA